MESFYKKPSNKNKSFLVVYPMGGGKSYLISLMNLMELGSFLILSPSVEITKQIKNKIKELKKKILGGIRK